MEIATESKPEIDPNPPAAVAASRLRRLAAGESAYDVYGTSTGMGVMVRELIDKAAVVKAYLADHPEDEHVNIDDSWLRSEGWDRGRDGVWRKGALAIEPGTFWWTWRAAGWRDVSTRGHLRRLVRVVESSAPATPPKS